VIHTGGGGFNRDDRFLFFIAGDRRVAEGGEKHDHALVAANILKGGQNLRGVDTMLDSGARVFLDSGVFTLTADWARATGRPGQDAFLMPPEELPGFRELWDLYVSLVRRYEDRLWGYVEIDLGGVAGKRRLRRKLHDLGLSPMPVYHPMMDGWDYFDELATGFDRLCWGNLAGGAQRAQRKRLVTTAWERHRRYPDLWLHLLGLNPNDWLVHLPADSADSSSWLSSVRWGNEHGGGYLRRVGTLPTNYRYARAEQIPLAIDLAAANAHFTHRTWRKVRQDLDRDLGAVAYPPPREQEVMKT
jgi:hypothetical protein